MQCPFRNDASQNYALIKSPIFCQARLRLPVLPPAAASRPPGRDPVA